MCLSAHFGKITLYLTFVFLAKVCSAVDGSEPVYLTVPAGATTGWKTFEVLTGGDDLTINGTETRAVEGFAWINGDYRKWDGLGAYRVTTDTLRVLINYEVTSSGFLRVDLDLSNLKAWILNGSANNTTTSQVAAPGVVVEAVSLGWLASNPVESLQRFCSGNFWPENTFGEGRGFADPLYLTGEEIFSAPYGNFWVMDIATRTLYKAADLGTGSWENATPFDTGRTDTVALILSEDAGASSTGTASIRLYVGKKLGSGDFLERNGLKGGKIYHWDPDGVSTDGTMTGIFSGGNGTVVSGEWKLDSTEAALFSKCEDVHVNENRDSGGYGVEVALASQEEAVFEIDLSTVAFVEGDLDINQSSDITVLYAAGTQASSNAFRSMDNLVWSPDGRIYVNEDDGEGDVWVIDPLSLKASYAFNDFTPDATQVYNILDANTVSESSGIIDISEYLDYQPGSIFLATGQSSTLGNNQLVLIVSPNAATLSAAYEGWALSFSELDTEAKRLPASDPDLDRLSNGIEFAIGFSPVVADSAYPVDLVPSSSQASFTADRSLNVVDYYIDYTSDLSAGFNQSILVRSGMIDGSGVATVPLPSSSQCFVRLSVYLP